MAPTPPPLASARSVSSKIRFFSSAVKMRRCALAGTSTSEELAAEGTAILASLTMFLLAALLCNYHRGRCLIDIGTEGYGEIIHCCQRARVLFAQQTAARLQHLLLNFARARQIALLIQRRGKTVHRR